jgi:hypothetical protein
MRNQTELRAGMSARSEAVSIMKILRTPKMIDDTSVSDL